jgi:cyclic beta-1,2-glucan synthetase
MTFQDSEAFIELHELGSFAIRTAEGLIPGTPVTTQNTVKSAERELALIKSVMQSATRFAEVHVSIPQEIEWLLDNWYIAEREGKCAVSDIKSTTKLKSAASTKKKLIVSEAAAALVKSGEGKVTSDRIETFLDAFQDKLCLSEAELSAFIPSVRLALISMLAMACKRLKFVITDGVVEENLSQLLGSIFTSLRFLSGFDASEILENVNRVERTLRLDPKGIYAGMDEQTRFSYRREIARLAEIHNMGEHEAAEKVLKLSCDDSVHVGFYVFSKPLGQEKKHRTGGFYIGFILLASLFFALLVSFMLDNPAISILLLLPVSEIVKNVTDYIVLHFIHPQRVQRLELAGGVPAEGKTVCVISILLSSTESGARAAGLLEEYRLSNRDAGRNLMFGILGDLPDAKNASLQNDEKFLLSAAGEIQRLNEKYGGGFYLFSRSRSFNERDRRYSAWERKRGAILELCRFLRNRESGLLCMAGDCEALDGTNYIITLDSDTRLCAGSAREMIGAALHPLNRPVIDRTNGIVTEGSGILQPRISVDLTAANQSDYTRIFAGQGGIDPYGGMTSDIYQNLFGTGSFAGKGIIDLDAYLACLDQRFPENTVLSHDLLEGAYLRCAFAGDIELTDGYPAKVTTYYDRMHRWTRGDWQNLPWLLGKVKNASGVKEKNHLGQIDRWKIADNLRRSLVPVFTLAALISGMLLDNVDFFWAALIAVFSAMSNLVISSTAVLLRKNHPRVRYQSAIISGFSGQFMQTVIRLILLPYEAFVSFSAIMTALYRMLVSRRHMLSWVTAADSEKKTKNNVVQCFRRMWPCIAISALILVFTPSVTAAAIAVIWAFSPLYVISLGRERRAQPPLTPQDRLFLSRCAGDIWRYFDEHLIQDDHYLPPDNVQEQPAVGTAHRTSPTNIGLALLSALAALDLGACPRENAIRAITNIFDTIHRLPKWNGHLYNWYDTLTLRVLQPAYVSAVDSGNFAGCLIALREGLLELGENALAETADKMLKGMSFTPLFDEKRQLFYIGWDISKGAPTEGWYDLLASEARQTSFIAIARGDIPRKHWRRLGRSLVAQDSFRGMASWTGTMFEYMMPELLLPCYKNSLIWESLKFCLYVQKKRAAGIPWGMSESAFYAFDHSLSYRYKAHGVQRLALKRGMGREAVVSPYSTFLALPVDPKAALRNLKRLQKMGMEGRYGFYEAADFTPSRLRGGKYEIVRTYMVHHLGMSLIAIDNVMKSGIMQRRFMRDREMAAFAELLQEKVPVGGIILRQPPRDVPEKPARSSSPFWSFKCDAIDVLSPRCCLLGNGAYSVIISETGQSRSVWNSVTLTKSSFEPFSHDAGMSFYLNCGDELVSLLPSPIFDRNVHYSAEMTGSFCRINAKSGHIKSSMTVSVPEGEAGELRTVEISSETQREAELICYFEPVLSRQSDYDSHPAFSKLSLETVVSDNAIGIKRRPRARGHGIAMALDISCPYSFDTSREAAIGRGGIASLKKALLKESACSSGSVLDPCVFVRIKLSLKPDSPSKVCLALSPASNVCDAAAAARRILGTSEAEGYSRLDETAQRLKLTPEQIERGMALLPGLIYPSPMRRVPEEDIPALSMGQKNMWRLGVSGDLPIVSVIINEEEDADAALELISLHSLIVENGVAFDLVFFIKDYGDYRSPLRSRIIDFLRAAGLEHKLSARGGFHVADAGAEGADTIRAASVYVIEPGEKIAQTERRENVHPVPVSFYSPTSAQKPEYRYNDDNSFTFKIQGELPQVAWSHMLSNGRYGYLATDAGTGHMWHLNARENKINRWSNDALSTSGTEKLELWQAGTKTSLFASPDGHECSVTYGFGYARWIKRIGGSRFVTTAFVPPDVDARVLIIEADCDGEAEIAYFTDLVLSDDESNSIYVKTKHDDDMISARSVYNADFSESVFHLTSSQNARAFTCSKAGWLTGELDGLTGIGFVSCAAAVYPAVKTLVIVTGCDAAEKLKKLADPNAAAFKLQETLYFWKNLTSVIQVNTPNEDLNRYVNGWALYQTYACRVLGRTSLYQSGGAYGFRDQLQDVGALIEEAPHETVAQLVRAAEHQFEEGDVQHWWHPGTSKGALGDKGVRTRCSDDLVWLPYTLCEYLEKTGDWSVCSLTAQYISSAQLAEDEHERYDQPTISAHAEPLLSHAIRALDLVLERGTGRHDLCFIGSGDWNDGMNLVGAGGEGESVWLTWFVSHTASKMAEVCLKQGNPGAAARYETAASALKKAADAAWDGEWFIRGYYDDGTPLGSYISDECKIDSIAQSFAALAGGDPGKTKTALISSVERLYDKNTRVVRLFDPPFSDGNSVPGYIKGYSPGFRENGGQYTHGAVWLAMGLFMAGMNDRGRDILTALLPQGRPDDIYKTEPYVLPADVYTGTGHVGRGGWTWYTGAAGWFKRVALENLLGLRLKNGVLHVKPSLPSDWAGYEAVWRRNGKEYRISVKNNGACEVTVDGQPSNDGAVVTGDQELSRL